MNELVLREIIRVTIEETTQRFKLMVDEDGVAYPEWASTQLIADSVIAKLGLPVAQQNNAG